MGLIFLVSSVTLLGSFACSLFEAALYAITPSQIEILRNSGRTGAAKLAALRADVEEPIAAILTINTITHTVGASVCGALVADHFGGGPAVGIFAALFTLAVLLFTEIIPKSYGVRHAVKLGPIIAWPLQVMVWSVWPIVKASGWLMRALTGAGGAPGATEEELRAASRLAHEAGEITPQERRWVDRALRLDELVAKDVVTPRTIVESVRDDVQGAELERTALSWEHSRVPVVSAADPDEVRGFVLRRDVVDAILRGDRPGGLEPYVREIQFVPDQAPLHKVLDAFIQKRKHVVGVVDEYGAFVGIVTLEDLLEEMLGTEILDEHDAVADKQAFARRRAKERFENREHRN